MIKKIRIITIILLLNIFNSHGAVKSLALVEFTKKGDIASSEADLVHNALEAVLIKETDIPLVDRGRIKKILKEQEIQFSGITTQDNAVKIGSILNVHYLMYGELSRSGGYYHVTLKVVSVENARVLVSETISGVSVKELIDNIKKVIPGKLNWLSSYDTYYPPLDDSDRGIKVQRGIHNKHPEFSISIIRSEENAGLYFDISRINIYYFSKIRLKLDKAIPVNMEIGLFNEKEEESEIIELNKIVSSGNTWVIDIAGFKISPEKHWTGISLIFSEELKDVNFVIKELVVLP